MRTIEGYRKFIAEEPHMSWESPKRSKKIRKRLKKKKYGKRKTYQQHVEFHDRRKS